VRHYHLGLDTGVLVAGIEPKSPAEHAGLAIGDIIVAIDEQPTPSVDSLHKLLSGDRIGARSTLKVVRSVELLTKTVVPLEMPALVGNAG
jgi:S1-C subfamily serine protease